MSLWEWRICDAKEVSPGCIVRGFERPDPAPSIASAAGYIWPVPGYGVTSPFGYRKHPISGLVKLHAGVDIAGPGIYGKPILAAADGKVIEARPSSGYGNIVVIYHGNGISTKYAHMEFSSIKVRAGQTVKKGQHIANVGNEGTSTNPHLHFEFLKWNRPIDPMQFY